MTAKCGCLSFLMILFAFLTVSDSSEARLFGRRQRCCNQSRPAPTYRTTTRSTGNVVNVAPRSVVSPEPEVSAPSPTKTQAGEHSSSAASDPGVATPTVSQAPRNRPTETVSQAPRNRPTETVGRIVPFREFQYISPQRRAARPADLTTSSSPNQADRSKQFDRSTAGHGPTVNACFWGRQPTLVIITPEPERDGKTITTFLQNYGMQRMVTHGGRRLWDLAKTTYNRGFVGAAGSMMGFEFAGEEEQPPKPDEPSLTKLDDIQLIMLLDGKRVWNETVYTPSNIGRAMHIGKHVGHEKAFNERGILGRMFLRRNDPDSQRFNEKFKEEGGPSQVYSGLATHAVSLINAGLSETADKLKESVPVDRFKLGALAGSQESERLMRSLLPGEGTEGKLTVLILDEKGQVARDPEGNRLVWKGKDVDPTKVAPAYYTLLKDFQSKTKSPPKSAPCE